MLGRLCFGWLNENEEDGVENEVFGVGVSRRVGDSVDLRGSGDAGGEAGLTWVISFELSCCFESPDGGGVRGWYVDGGVIFSVEVLE